MSLQKKELGSLFLFYSLLFSALSFLSKSGRFEKLNELLVVRAVGCNVCDGNDSAALVLGLVHHAETTELQVAHFLDGCAEVVIEANAFDMGRHDFLNLFFQPNAFQ